MKNLCEAREVRGMTQDELALKVGVSHSSISRYETGERSPTLAIAVKIALTLNTSLDYLLGIDNTTPPPTDEGDIELAHRMRALTPQEKEKFRSLLEYTEAKRAK